MNLIKKFLFLAAPRSLRFFEQIGLWWTLFLVSEYDLIKRAGLCILILFYSIRAAFVIFGFYGSTLEEVFVISLDVSYNFLGWKELDLNFCPHTVETFSKGRVVDVEPTVYAMRWQPTLTKDATVIAGKSAEALPAFVNKIEFRAEIEEPASGSNLGFGRGF